MECNYGIVRPRGPAVSLVGSDQFVTPPAGIINDYVQARRRAGGRSEKQSVVKYDTQKDLSSANYARQVNESDKNTYFYKLRRVLPGLHDTRAGQPQGKVLPDRMFDNVVKAKKLPPNGNFMRRVGKVTSANNDFFKPPYMSGTDFGTPMEMPSQDAVFNAMQLDSPGLTVPQRDMDTLGGLMGGASLISPGPVDTEMAASVPPTPMDTIMKGSPAPSPVDTEMLPSATGPLRPNAPPPIVTSGFAQTSEKPDRTILNAPISPPKDGMFKDVKVTPIEEEIVKSASPLEEYQTPIDEESPREIAQSPLKSAGTPMDTSPVDSQVPTIAKPESPETSTGETLWEDELIPNEMKNLYLNDYAPGVLIVAPRSTFGGEGQYFISNFMMKKFYDLKKFREENPDELIMVKFEKNKKGPFKMIGKPYSFKVVQEGNRKQLVKVRDLN